MNVGSPPRARGALDRIATALGHHRITPRAREHELDFLERADGGGSPPRARGSTRTMTSTRLRTTDHPRVRGEHFYLNNFVGNATGSPPACAGSTRLVTVSASALADHPSCAGSTCPRSRRCCARQDHPRVRGSTAMLATPTTPTSSLEPVFCSVASQSPRSASPCSLCQERLLHAASVVSMRRASCDMGTAVSTSNIVMPGDEASPSPGSSPRGVVSMRAPPRSVL
jgi:hypothetical protein